ncbi:MAG: hypothetical protein Q8L29_00065 [archaeon]|nr:hypothetical protein [archaeon]
MEVKTIKGISGEKWIKFKSLAAEKNVPLGVLFGMMLESYYRRADSLWNKVLNEEKVLSDSEAEEMVSAIKKIRKERGFRI